MFPGFVLSGAGLALVLYALTQGPEKGWRSPQVLATGIVGIVMFVMLVVVERVVPEPLLGSGCSANACFATPTC